MLSSRQLGMPAGQFADLSILSIVVRDPLAQRVDLIQQSGERGAQKLGKRVEGAFAERAGDRLGQAHAEPLGDTARY